MISEKILPPPKLTGHLGSTGLAITKIQGEQSYCDDVNQVIPDNCGPH